MSPQISIFLWCITVLVTWVFQWWLRTAQIFQKIYELSPETHQKKRVTPSLGGAVFVPLIALFTLCLSPITGQSLWLMGLFLAFSAIGFWDDVSSLRAGKNKGLSARKKFWMQNSIGGLFLIIFHLCIAPILLWEALLYLFILTGTSNATNLTDGLDGLLTGLAIVTFWGFYNLGALSIQPVAYIVVVVLAGFLMLNHHPAKIFMGDTGSLGLGALMAGMAIVMQQPFILIPLGAVYILETLSVMIQVAYFKRTQKRIFLMAPLHHHFELMGLKETTVVRLFWLMGLGFLMLYVGLVG